MFDVAIIGAGPSGSWAAYLLARQGARVVLLDGSHPREKPCGGGVTGRALTLVASADPGMSRLGVGIERVRFLDSTRPGAMSSEVDLSSAGLIVVSRRDFDRRLLDLACAAGAEFVAERVTDLGCSGGAHLLRTARGTSVSTRVLVGADGVSSLVRRHFAAPFRREQLSLATGFFVHGVSETEIRIAFAADPPGYFWSFPRPDHVAIGVCAQADAGMGSAGLRSRTAAWMRDAGIIAGATRWEPYSWPIPSLRDRDLANLPVAGETWCLIGDAAGLVDPITREGIYFALQSAEVAADAIGAGRVSSYEMRVRHEVITELRRAARLKAGFFRPQFIHLVMHGLAASAAIRAIMADLIVGNQSYRGLAWRLLRTREARLAWQLVTLRGRSTPHAPEHALPVD